MEKNNKLQFYNKSKRPNRFGLPEFIVRAFEFSPRDYDLKYVDNSIGVTTLTDSPKIKLLRKKYKDRVAEDNDISSDSKMFFGTMAHLLIERAVASYYADKEYENMQNLIPISEKRVIIKVPAAPEYQNLDFNIVMKPDLYYPERTFPAGMALTKDMEYVDGALWDLKTGTTWDWIFRAEKIKTWREQLEPYKFGIETYGFEITKVDPTTGQKTTQFVKHKVKKAYILLWMKDWQAGKQAQDPNYPENDMMVLEISLADVNVIKSRIKARLILHALYQDDPQSYNCTTEERWSKETKYAVYSEPGSKRATKVFDNEQEAKDFVTELSKKFPMASYETRVGLPTRCLNYCAVANFCNQYRRERGMVDIEEADKFSKDEVVINPVKDETKETPITPFSFVAQEVAEKDKIIVTPNANSKTNIENPNAATKISFSFNQPKIEVKTEEKVEEVKAVVSGMFKLNTEVTKNIFKQKEETVVEETTTVEEVKPVEVKKEPIKFSFIKTK